MAEQEMLLDTATIRAAVDEDMKQHLILKLLEELPNFPMGQA